MRDILGKVQRLWIIASFVLLVAACVIPAQPPPDGASLTEVAGPTEMATPSPATAGAAPSDSAPTTADCAATQPDMLGPFYKAGAPERNSVGSGYTLSGKVFDADGCSPIAGAQIEFWMAGPSGVYSDEFRATWHSADDGSYRFTSHVPVAYSGRPPHIHVRVTADGFSELVTQHYPQQGEHEATMDLVLEKSSE